MKVACWSKISWVDAGGACGTTSVTPYLWYKLLRADTFGYDFYWAAKIVFRRSISLVMFNIMANWASCAPET